LWGCSAYQIFIRVAAEGAGTVSLPCNWRRGNNAKVHLLYYCLIAFFYSQEWVRAKFLSAALLAG
jgi:hypothetical protein